ncbi:MAG: hypothetical protein H0T53_05940 [Herpetosiphonaceae bacterium]|nr:hypothetical protein [Herpetosiphonaceae bacterium]
MKRHWKQILFAAISALASTAIAALTRRDDPPAERPAGNDAAPGSAATAKSSAGIRGVAVGFLSDVMAETYRKVRAEQSDKRR